MELKFKQSQLDNSVKQGTGPGLAILLINLFKTKLIKCRCFTIFENRNIFFPTATETT